MIIIIIIIIIGLPLHTTPAAPPVPQLLCYCRCCYGATPKVAPAGATAPLLQATGSTTGHCPTSTG